MYPKFFHLESVLPVEEISQFTGGNGSARVILSLDWLWAVDFLMSRILDLNNFNPALSLFGVGARVNVVPSATSSHRGLSKASLIVFERLPW